MSLLARALTQEAGASQDLSWVTRGNDGKPQRTLKVSPASPGSLGGNQPDFE